MEEFANHTSKIIGTVSGSERIDSRVIPHLSRLCSSMHQGASERVHDARVQGSPRGSRTSGAGKNKRISLRHTLNGKRRNVGGEGSVERLDECISHDGVPCVRGVDSVEREYPAEKIDVKDSNPNQRSTRTALPFIEIDCKSEKHTRANIPLNRRHGDDVMGWGQN
jgi:hypothetical protein